MEIRAVRAPAKYPTDKDARARTTQVATALSLVVNIIDLWGRQRLTRG